MASKRKYLHLIPSFVVATSLILSACKDNGQSTVRVAGAGGNSKATESDVNGRQKLSPSQEGMKQSPEQIVSILAGLFDTSSKEFPLSTLVQLKTWVAGAMDVQKESVTGIISETYSKETRQLQARQTQKLILINDPLLKRQMNVTDAEKTAQKEIYLKEFLISLYSLRNFSDDQLCTYVKSLFKEAQCASKVSDEQNIPDENVLAARTAGKNKNEIVPSSTPTTTAQTVVNQPMTQADYNNVDKVETEILSKGSSLSSQDLLALMDKSNFDLRIFKFQINAEPSSDLISEQMQSLYNQLASLDKTSSICYSVGLGTKVDCDISMNAFSYDVPSNVENEVVTLKGLNFSLREKDSKDIFIPVQQMVFSKKGHLIAKKDGSKDLYLLRVGGASVIKNGEGSAYRVQYVVVTKDSKNAVKAEALVSVAGVITKISEDAKKCEGKLAEAKDKGSDMILLAKSDAYLSSIKKVMTSIPCY